MTRHASGKAERLLVELNHRVMNTLAMIASIVRMEAGQLEADSAGRQGMARLQSRLAAVSALRGAAVTFGCEADRAALKTEMTDYLSAWANEALDGVADGEVDNPDQALRLVGIAARFLTLIEALEAARAIRRRAATAETVLLPQ